MRSGYRYRRRRGRRRKMRRKKEGRRAARLGKRKEGGKVEAKQLLVSKQAINRIEQVMVA